VPAPRRRNSSLWVPVSSAIQDQKVTTLQVVGFGLYWNRD
jgi:hypothetical protein